MRSRALVSAALLTLATFSATVRAQELTPREKQELELLQKPESWFLKQLGGKREMVDGQSLDPKLQYMFVKYWRKPVPEQRDPLATAEGRAVIEDADRAATQTAQIFGQAIRAHTPAH